jgi:general stress protein 26
MLAPRPEGHEVVSIYRLDDQAREELLSIARECVFNWCTKDQHPMGVIMSCFWHKGSMWLTATAQRHRISAVRRNPRVSVVISSTSTEIGPNKTITIKGRCTVREDQETKDWFYPAFASHLMGEGQAAKDFEKMLDSPLRVVLEVVPEKFISYDGTKMFRHAAGTLDESELASPLEADSVRLAIEKKRRGME